MTMLHADILTWAQTYTGPKFHALLCDPPYHLTSIVDRFGKEGSAPAQDENGDGPYTRTSRGFMGKTWDGGDIAFRPSTWAAIAQHLYPGAWGMVFASSRGWHRLAVAIEDAGLIIQPTIFGWAYGSGFPKATNISAQIDDRAFRAWLVEHPAERDQLETLRQQARLAPKAQRVTALRAYQQARKQIKAAAGFAPVAQTKKHQPKFAAAELGYREKDNGFNSKDRESFDVHGPATASAADWAGHRYGGQAIKPALEPIIVFQKPYDGSPIDNITSTGAGALWIDGGRIAGDVPSVPQPQFNTTGTMYGFKAGEGRNGEMSHAAGRWPANLVLTHAPECNGVCIPSCPVARLGAQSGELTSGTGSIKNATGDGHQGLIFGPDNRPQGTRMIEHHDSGTAARYFYAADWMLDRLEAADPVSYIAKASRAEREAGLDPRQTALMRLPDEGAEDFEDARTNPRGSDGRAYDQRAIKVKQCTVCGKRSPNGMPGTACGHDSWEWVPQIKFDPSTVDDGREVSIDNPYQRGETTRRNIHPTIKPLSLSKYLATLLLPPDAYAPRRLLVPFAGAGSEVCGAELAGWEEVTGVELEESHVQIAKARQTYWRQMRHKVTEASTSITTKAGPDTPKGQLDMFADNSTD